MLLKARAATRGMVVTATEVDQEDMATREAMATKEAMAIKADTEVEEATAEVAQEEDTGSRAPTVEAETKAEMEATANPTTPTKMPRPSSWADSTLTWPIGTSLICSRTRVSTPDRSGS